MKKNDRENIIVLGLPRWDGRYSSTSLSLAQELSKQNNVFYIDNPFTVKEVVTNFRSKQIRSRLMALLYGSKKYKTADGFPNLTYVTPRMVIPVNFIPVNRLYDFFSSLNDKLVYLCINDLFKMYEINDFIFINSYNPFYSLKFPSSFRPSLRVYHCVDDISESKYVARHGVRLEKRIMGVSDFTLATSKELVRLKTSHSKRIFYLPNAANFKYFQKYSTDKKIENVANIGSGKSVIGYIGNICHRLDYQLLFEVIKKHRDKVFLFVGPVSNAEVKESGVFDLPNVIFVGSKPMKDLPKYLSRMDCTIIPFKRNKLTRSIYPLKINEYLSMGKPVVSTIFSEDIHQFKEYISLENDSDRFSKAISKELNGDDNEKQERRIKVASTNTWESRAEEFWNIVKKFKLEQASQ